MAIVKYRPVDLPPLYKKYEKQISYALTRHNAHDYALYVFCAESKKIKGPLIYCYYQLKSCNMVIVMRLDESGTIVSIQHENVDSETLVLY